MKIRDDSEYRDEMNLRKSIKDQVNGFIHKNGCWLWRGEFNGAGACVVKLKGYGVYTLAHRAVYRSYVGAIPITKHLRRTCLNSHCVNPDHMKLINRHNKK